MKTFEEYLRALKKYGGALDITVRVFEGDGKTKMQAGGQAIQLDVRGPGVPSACFVVSGNEITQI